MSRGEEGERLGDGEARDETTVVHLVGTWGLGVDFTELSLTFDAEPGHHRPP